MVYDNEEMNRRLFLDVCEHKCLFAVFSGLLFDRESNRIHHEADKNQRTYIYFAFKSLFLPRELTFIFPAKNCVSAFV